MGPVVMFWEKAAAPTHAARAMCATAPPPRARQSAPRTTGGRTVETEKRARETWRANLATAIKLAMQTRMLTQIIITTMARLKQLREERARANAPIPRVPPRGTRVPQTKTAALGTATGLL